MIGMFVYIEMHFVNGSIFVLRIWVLSLGMFDPRHCCMIGILFVCLNIYVAHLDIESKDVRSLAICI